MRLTPAMKKTLAYMGEHYNSSYADRWDRTMIALKKRGLVSFYVARGYGKDCWSLTPEGKKFVETSSR